MPAAPLEPVVQPPAEPPQNYAAVKAGLIPLTAQERIKQEKDGLDVIHDIYRYAQTGFASITEDDFERLKWYGVYRQKPKDSGYFMLRTKVPGGQLSGAQARRTFRPGLLRHHDAPDDPDALAAHRGHAANLRRVGRCRHHHQRRVR